MPAQDLEILTMSRCRRHLEPLSASARQRVVNYLQSLVVDMPVSQAKPDPRQPPLPGTESPFDAE